MKVELSENWWKTLWNKKLEADPHKKDTAVLGAIKAYKKALRGKSQTSVINALDALEQEFLDSTRRNLRKRKDLSQSDSVYLDTALGAALDLVERKRKAAVESGASMKTIYNIDFGTVIKRFHKGTLFVDEKRPIEVKMLQLVIDELDALGAAPDLYNQIDKRVEARAKEYVDLVEDFFDKNAGKIDKKRFDAHAKNTSDVVVKKLKADLETIPTDIMRRVRIHRDIAKKYRKERAVAVGKSVASATLAAGGLGVPGSTPFAAVMLARSIADLSREIADTATTLKRKVKIFKGYLNELSSAYESHKGEKEIARDSVNAALGVDVVPTIDRAKDMLKNIEKDTASTLFRARQANKGLAKLVEKNSAIEKKLNASGIKPNVLKRTKLKAQLDIAERDVNKLADSVYRLMKHAEYAEQRIPEMRRGLADIGKLSGRVEKAKVAIRGTLAVATTLGGAGDASVASQLASAAEKAGSIGLALEGTFETAKDLVDDMKELG